MSEPSQSKQPKNKPKHIIVMGAGVVGVTTAWYLRQAGFDVTVIDRQPAAGMETSKANGGQISVSHAEPWANPSAPMQIAKWLLNRDAPLKFSPSLDFSQWQWGLQFYRECGKKSTQENIKNLVNLGMYSRQALQTLRDELSLEYQQVKKGILHIYTDRKQFEHAKHMADYMTHLGCDRQVLSTAEALAIDPALASINSLVGATYTQADESGNAFIFTQKLTEHCKASGVNFLFDTRIDRLHEKEGELTHISITHKGEQADIHADSYVLCLGSYSTILAKQIGLNLLVYPAKGYSATFNVTDATKVPHTSLIDDAQKLVFSRFQSAGIDQLRIAGMAEIQAGKQKYNTEINPNRAALITRRVQQLFPTGLDFSQPNYWTGLRPTTPSNVPYIGHTRFKNLLLNTGHGTLGWTHACGSAKALSEVVKGRQPEVDFTFL